MPNYLLVGDVRPKGRRQVCDANVDRTSNEGVVRVDGLLWLDLQHNVKSLQRQIVTTSNRYNVKSLKHFKCSQQLKALFRLVAGCCRLTVDCSSAVKIEKFQLIATHCISRWSQENRYSLNDFSALNDHGLFTNVKHGPSS